MQYASYASNRDGREYTSSSKETAREGERERESAVVPVVA